MFLGASYFRALGRNQGYGVSARGLAIDTATRRRARNFPISPISGWSGRSRTRARMTIYALLDSPSLAGAYQFERAPRHDHPGRRSRRSFIRGAPVDKLGIAPLTSMFLYGESSERASASMTGARRCTTATV